MPYFAVDDGMYDHPKFDGLSDAAVALWAKAGSWSMRYLTDGHVPADRVRKLGYEMEAAEELVRRGLWCGLLDGLQAGFRFHEWEKHQNSKAEVEKARDRWREEKRIKRAAKSDRKPEMSGPDSGVDSGKDSGPESFAPTQPNPITSSSKKAKPRKRGPRDDLFDLVRDTFESAHARAHEVHQGVQASLVAQVVTWALGIPAETREATIKRAIAGFFLDPFWRGEGSHPFVMFAKAPGQFVKHADAHGAAVSGFKLAVGERLSSIGADGTSKLKW